MREIPSAKNLMIPVLLVAAIFIVQFQRAEEQVPLWRYEGMTMGTSFTVQIYHGERLNRTIITHALENVNQQMSTYLKDSELSKLNQAPLKEVHQISPPLRTVLSAAKEVSQASGGAFDITVGPLVNAWGFGPDGRKPTPNKLQLTELKARCGDQLWTLNQDGVSKVRSDVSLDLSAIAKGFAVDEVARALDAHQVQSYWIEVGGEVKVKGTKPQGALWRVGIERPAGEEQRKIFRVMHLHNLSVATSGDYRNRYRDDQGMIRSHTIDPRTGEPVHHQLASVSVFHDQNMLADAWATALNVLGPDQGLKVANQKGIEALFIIRQPLDQNENNLSNQELDNVIDLDSPQTSYRAVLSDSLKQRLTQEEQAKLINQ